MLWRRRHTQKSQEIDPDEILIDSSNLPEFDKDQFEGRMERPLSHSSITATAVVVLVLLALLMSRAGYLQLWQGGAYAKRAIDNQLSEQTVFAERGTIVDRTGVVLADNNRHDITDEFAQRVYTSLDGIAHVVGYVKPPAKDVSGVYFRNEFIGMDGVERAYNTQLAGTNGIKLTETNARGKIVSESVVEPPVPGEKITLSIDAQVTQGLFRAIADKAQHSGFQGGAGVLMDVRTGELLALTSYPEYHSQALTDGDSDAIKRYNSDSHQPFLNRVINGLYSPGSIVKPVMGIAALTEGVISEDKQILSTGSISLPNPYDPEHPSVFKDWRANGWVDVRHAIAVSSDVYFYAVGGGYEDQRGMGIDNIDKYLRLFGFGSTTGLAGFKEPSGNIATPAWKEQNFPGDPWRIGDTYHTVIGQYGTQVTPLQAVREAAAIANGGVLLKPSLFASSTQQGTPISVPAKNVQVVREGMRIGVTTGIAQSVNFDFVHVAAKTGTAQVGTRNQYLNSWMIGFFPYEHPRYAYAVVLEKGPAGTVVGAPAAVSEFLQWMHENVPQYLE